MNIYKVILKANKDNWPNWPRVEMYFTHRPTNDQIINRLKAKTDPEIVYTLDSLGWIEWFLGMVEKHPIGDGSTFDMGSIRSWRDYPDAGTPMSSCPLHGQTHILELTVTENG